jgi:hypothetical protein
LDIGQIAQDKNGQQITVEDVAFEAPARIGFLVAFEVISDMYPDILEATGALIRYFKDNNKILVNDFTWHGNEDKTAFIEPIVRQPDERRVSVQTQPSLSLHYMVEVGINSEKGTPFKRVERRKIDGKIK